MTPDEEIEEDLDRGDVEAACLLAAKLPKPIAYREAMIRINAIVQAGMYPPKGKPVIEFEEKTATLIGFETDKRVSDDVTKEALPIAEVSFAMNLSGDMLAIFSPTLRSLLFETSGAVQHDLASQTHDAPDVRHPKILPPYRWRENMEGATVTIHQGLGGKSDLVLPEAGIATFFITPNDGGTVGLVFTARAKLDQEKAFGRLAMLLKKEVTISLEAAKQVPDED